MEDENNPNVMDMKKFKKEGQFNNNFLQTCPQPIIIDGTNDRPLEEKQYVSAHKPGNLAKGLDSHIAIKSKEFLNRIDQYKLNEESFDVSVIDDFGVSIIYDTSI